MNDITIPADIQRMIRAHATLQGISEDGTTFEYRSKTSGFVDETNVIAMGNLCFQFVKRSATVWRMIGVHPV